MRRLLMAGAVLLSLAGSLAARPAGDRPLPERLADTGGGSQLITAEAPSLHSTTGTVTWWDLRGGSWHRSGSAAARFGAKGLADGATRRQGTDTTPTGIFDLPFAFGIKAAPAGTRYPYRAVGSSSWWCEDNASRAYNRWVDPLPADCGPGEAERLNSYPVQYARALVIGFNYARPVHGRGGGIFLHINGAGATAGCVSVPAAAVDRILTWAAPGAVRTSRSAPGPGRPP